MSVNLASKYSNKIVGKFTKNSFLMGNTSTDYDWDGVKSISVFTPQTVDLSTYDRKAKGNRFGTPVEMQDEVQTLTLTQEPSFAITIDKGNNQDQMLVKKAGKMMNMQIAEKVTPFMDKYALDIFCHKAGIIEGVAVPTKTTIVERIFDAAKAMDNNLVPDDNRILYLPTSMYSLLRLSSEFLAVDNLAEKALAKGVVGQIADMKVIKVPDRYFPADVHFLITHKRSVVMPIKIKTARILTDVAGLDGSLLEGRNYFDAFVLGAKAAGVYAAVTTNKVVAAPTITIAANEATIASTTSGATIVYTLDGSDPRYSTSAKVYVAKVSVAAGEKVKAYAYKEGMFDSAVAEG